ncbi:MAG TPA: hypothetical protein VFI70_08525 [Nitrososphaeraceae archaeon]|nr:hypothetical protein [Nitrososphaeraceae archaeon]
MQLDSQLTSIVAWSSDDFANSYNSAKAQKTAKSQLQEFIRNAEWAGIDPLEARRMIEDPLKARGVDARYIRKILPKKYKYEYQDRTKKGLSDNGTAVFHTNSSGKLRMINGLVAAYKEKIDVLGRSTIVGWESK